MKHLIFASALAATALTAAPALAQNDSLTTSTKEQHLHEAVVKAVRASQNAPFAVTEVKGNTLTNFSKTGRELPMLFSHTPGVMAWGENGLGTGSVYMRMRGAGGSRINVTLDGVPLNSPEDQTVFWANMNSYGSLLGSAQIQRGIGTSTNGDGAFGGTISLLTALPSRTPQAEITGSYGSYNTYNVGGSFSTGLLWNHLIFNGAYHETGTDGFLHGTDGRSGSYLGGLTYFGRNFTLKYRNIGNFEKTGQAWNGVVAGNDDASLMNDGIRKYQDMYEHGLGRFNSLYESLVATYDDNWNVTFPKDSKGNYQTQRYSFDNGKLWDRATDNFYQNHNILSGSWMPNDHWTHTATLHYTYGYGYYNEFKPNYKFSKFGLTAHDAEGNEITRSDFVRKKGLTQNTYGVIYNANYKDEKWDVIGGVNLQQFRCNHWGYVKYVADKGQVEDFEGTKYYDSDAQKFDYSGFVKATFSFAPQWNVFGDLQYRHVSYRTTGKNDKFESETSRQQILHVHEHYNFVNPKAGITFHEGGHKAYFSVAYASREPERNNFTDNGKYPAPDAEHLLDFETGYNYSAHNWHAGVNLYYMYYKDQFVQTGEVSDIGEALTTNIDKSYRLGAEIEADWSPLSCLTVSGNASLSTNKLKDFNEVVDNWDGDPVKKHYSNSTLAFSPSALLNGFVNFHMAGFTAEWHTGFVSRQYLDNTENKQRSLPSYTQSDLNMSYALSGEKIKRAIGIREIDFGISMNNIFDYHYARSGWVYSAVSESSGYTMDNRYYQIGFIPSAGFTMMGNITLKF